MRCRMCQRDMEEKSITVDLRMGDKLFVVEEVPAKVCNHCGEKVFTLAIARKLQNLVKRRRKAPRTVRVPVYSLKRKTASSY
jgi:HTH-type transcriptional regulator/antitoxin MqsA